MSHSIQQRETSPLDPPTLGEESEDETYIQPLTDRAKKVLFTEILREHTDLLFCWECGDLVHHSWLGFHLWDDHKMMMDCYFEKHGKVVVGR